MVSKAKSEQLEDESHGMGLGLNYENSYPSQIGQSVRTEPQRALNNDDTLREEEGTNIVDGSQTIAGAQSVIDPSN